MHRERVDPVHPEPAVIRRAAALLRDGRLVAFPTETVYGLGANALDEDAVRRVYDAKGRPAHNPLIAHVPDADAAARLAREWPDTAARLAAAFWPGPLTLVVPRARQVPAIVAAGLPDLAVRVPDHPVALALLQTAGVPVVAPSANPSTAVSPTTADHVERGIGARVDLLLDAGPTRFGIESTVVDLSGERPLLLRTGSLHAADIERITGPLHRPSHEPGGPRHASPGMMDRHYAPRARLWLFAPERREQAARIAREAADAGRQVGALLLDHMEGPVHHPVRMPRDAAGYARQLYATLHALDDRGCALILVEDVPHHPDWDGVRDRLRRAAGGGGSTEGGGRTDLAE